MTTTDIDRFVFAKHDTTDLVLDVFRPDQRENRHCAILILHGGGWRAGSKELVHSRARALAARGFTAIPVQYRLLDEAAWPAQLEDAVTACTWVRSHADALDIDPATLVVQGHSAGAQMALLTGTLTADVRPAAIVAYYPPIGFHTAPPPRTSGDPDTPPMPSLPLELDELGRAPGWMLFPHGAAEQDLATASPISQLHTGFPPTIILHATADQLFDIRSSIALHQRLTELDVATDLHIYADRDHDFDRAPSMTEATTSATTSFLKRAVTHREDSDNEARRYSFPPTEQP